MVGSIRSSNSSPIGYGVFSGSISSSCNRNCRRCGCHRMVIVVMIIVILFCRIDKGL